MASRKMNGLTSGATVVATPTAMAWAWFDSVMALSANRAASSASWFGFIGWVSGRSGGLLRQEIRVNGVAAAGQHDAFHDIIGFRQLGRPSLLIPEGRQEGQQVAGIEG